MAINLTLEQLQDVKVAATNAAPGLTASVVTKAEGLTGANMVVYCTVLLLVIQCLYYAWKWRRDIRRHKWEQEQWALKGRGRRKTDRVPKEAEPCDTHEDSGFQPTCDDCTGKAH